jgi:hypothetical protein
MITSAQPSAKMLASIQAIHDIYNNEYNRLKLAHQGREQARIQRDAELKANPPKPQDITLNYWNIDPATITEKGAAR